MNPDSVAAALTTPPADTRATARAALMHAAAATDGRYFVDWETFDLEGHATVQLLNPFDPATPPLERAVPRPDPAPEPDGSRPGA
jgi:hypothetical protein